MMYRIGFFEGIFQDLRFSSPALAGVASVAVFAACAAAGCSGGAEVGQELEPDGGDLNDSETPGELALQVVENPSNVLSYYVSWTTEQAVETVLDLDCDDGAYTAHYESSEARTEHEVFVMGLYDGATCTVTATAAADPAATGEATFQAGPLPEFLPELEVTVQKNDAVQPGWTLFNLNNVFDGTPLPVAMVDARGRYRWYHQVATSATGSDTDVRVVERGVLIGGTRGQVWPQIVDWEGQVVWKRELYTHHAIRPYGDDQLMYLWDTDDCPSGRTAGTVVRYDFSEDAIVWEWALCQHYEPPNPVWDWAHLNTIELTADGTSVLLSSRNQNTLFMVDMESGGVEWMLGERGDFEIAPGDQFYHQHAPEFLPNGNILLFDNGLDGTRNYSRAIELSYDVEARTAEVVWEYRPQPDLFTPIWGDADLLPNGNRLITFGERVMEKNSHIVEVNAAGEEVWELVAPDKWGWYRAQRVVEPPTGYVVE
jgi:hypothetical protein